MATLLHSKGATCRNLRKVINQAKAHALLQAKLPTKPPAPKAVYLVAVLAGAAVRGPPRRAPVTTAQTLHPVPALRALPLFGSKALVDRVVPGRPTALAMKPA